MTTFPCTIVDEVARAARQSLSHPFIVSRSYFSFDAALSTLETQAIAAATHEPNEKPTFAELSANVTIESVSLAPHCARRLTPHPVCTVGFLLGTSNGGPAVTAMQADVYLVLVSPMNPMSGTSPTLRYQRKIIGRVRPNTDAGADTLTTSLLSSLIDANATNFATNFFAAAYANQIAVTEDRALTPGLKVNGAGAHGIATVSFETEGATHLEIWANCRSGCRAIVPFFRTW